MLEAKLRTAAIAKAKDKLQHHLAEQALVLAKETSEREKAVMQCKIDRYLLLVQTYLERHDSTPCPWIADQNVTRCQNCTNEFSILRRKHHCRVCGNVVCHNCMCYRSGVEGFADKKKVFRVCFSASSPASPSSLSSPSLANIIASVTASPTANCLELGDVKDGKTNSKGNRGGSGDKEGEDADKRIELSVCQWRRFHRLYALEKEAAEKEEAGADEGEDSHLQVGEELRLRSRTAFAK